jgi:predicted RNA-binding protein with PUA-like domain
MAYWLFKTEPGAWSWDDQVKTGTDHWDGVRNYQANNNMKATKVSDQDFFYHSVNEKQVVGIVEIVREHYPDHTDDSQRFGMVDIKTVMPVKTPVTLADCKSNPKLEKMTLVNNSRLSVQPVTPTEWKEVCRMAGVKA